MGKVESKITHVANGLGIMLPQEVVQHLGIKHGDHISFHMEGNEIRLQKSKKSPATKEVDQDFLDSVNEMMDKYDETFKGLVDR